MYIRDCCIFVLIYTFLIQIIFIFIWINVSHFLQCFDCWNYLHLQQIHPLFIRLCISISDYFIVFMLCFINVPFSFVFISLKLCFNLFIHGFVIPYLHNISLYLTSTTLKHTHQFKLHTYKFNTHTHQINIHTPVWNTLTNEFKIHTHLTNTHQFRIHIQV